MPQIVRDYLSNLTGDSKSLFSSQGELTPTEETRRLAFVLVGQERLHLLDQQSYIHNSMFRSVNACHTLFLEEVLTVLVSKGCAG